MKIGNFMIRAIPRSSINPPPRLKPRRQSKVKKVEIRRAIDAVKSLGLIIGGVEIRPDGTISIATVEGTRSAASDIFSQWSDRL